MPLALWVRGTGSLVELTSPAVTITGARASSDEGDAIAADISHELTCAGVTVVSGGALGIDAAAHAARSPPGDERSLCCPAMLTAHILTSTPVSTRG